MEDFLSGIGFLAILGGILYLITHSLQKKEDREKDNEDLFKYTYISDDKFDKSISRAKNIEKILSVPGVKKEAEERKRKGIEIMAQDEDRMRKEKILKRTYSYKYEDVVYEIFSPYAVKEENPWMEKKYGKWRIYKSIDKYFFRSEIARILNISEDEASELMFYFDKNDLIEITTIPNTWKQACSLGHLLEYDWDIISKQDKNFSLWIDSHQSIESKESFESRQKEYINNNNLYSSR